MSVLPNIHSAAAYLLRFDEDVASLSSPIEEVANDAIDYEPADINVAEHCATQVDTVREEYHRLLIVHQEQQQGIQSLLEDARREWVSHEGGVIADKLLAAYESAFESLRIDIARVLELFLGQKISFMAVSDLIEALRNTESGAGALSLSMSGRKDLVDAVASAIKDRNISVEVTECDGDELKLSFQTTRIETRIREWVSTIGELAEDAQ